MHKKGWRKHILQHLNQRPVIKSFQFDNCSGCFIRKLRGTETSFFVSFYLFSFLLSLFLSFLAITQAKLRFSFTKSNVSVARQQPWHELNFSREHQRSFWTYITEKKTGHKSSNFAKTAKLPSWNLAVVHVCRHNHPRLAPVSLSQHRTKWNTKH